MRYLMMVMLAGVLLCGYAVFLHAVENPTAPATTSDEAAKKKQITEIQVKIRTIEKGVVSQDEECKKLQTQIVELQKQQRARLDTLLEKNEEYQALKKQLKELISTLATKKEISK